MVERVDRLEQFERALAVAAQRGGEHRPERGVRVLRAVLAYTGQVALDVAGVVRHVIERRREQHDQPRVVAHELVLERAHRLLLARRIAGAGDHAPALRDRIDAALLARARAERRAIVEVGAPIPFAVPATRLHGSGVRRRLRPELRRGGRIAARGDVLGEIPQRGGEEPAEPDALAAPFDAHATHAVVPVADADQRQAVRASRGRLAQGAQAMLVHGRLLVADLRQVVDLVLVRRERAHRDERHDLVEHARVAGDAHVLVHDVGQPREIVGEAGAHAASTLRMPPVLDVALDELAGGGAQDVLARHRGLRIHERHDVLQLVAESVRAARLIECRARPHAARERLVERPAIHHRVERGLRRADADDREPPLPLFDRLVHRRPRPRRVAV